MFLFPILITTVLSYHVGGFGLGLGSLLKAPYPELGVHQNVVAESTEKIIAAIETAFNDPYDFYSRRTAISILMEIALVMQPRTEATEELIRLSRLMQTPEILKCVADMKLFVAMLPRTESMKSSIRVYKVYVEFISRAVDDLKDPDISNKKNGVNLLFNGLSFYRGHLTNFYDIIKLRN